MKLVEFNRELRLFGVRRGDRRVLPDAQATRLIESGDARIIRDPRFAADQPGRVRTGRPHTSRR